MSPRQREKSVTEENHLSVLLHTHLEAKADCRTARQGIEGDNIVSRDLMQGRSLSKQEIFQK